MHAFAKAHRMAMTWLAAAVGSAALLLALPAVSGAEESNPNNYNCLGHLAPGSREEGSEEQQVRYVFYCNGPITGYQVSPQLPLTGIQSPPLVTDIKGNTAADMFSCSGDIPGYAANCVGSAKSGYETVTGQFAIGKRICAEPRVDALLSVTYAYLEKGVVTQAISGPFDLGRPVGCPADGYSGGTRLNPSTPSARKTSSKHHHKVKKARRRA